MSAVLDAQLGFKAESTYGTGVVVDRFLAPLAGESLDYKPNRKQGEGLRAGARFPRSNRRVTTSSEGGGDFSVEALSKGQGALWELLMGSGAGMLVSGTTYQQNFTIADVFKPFTLQKGVPRIGATGAATIDAITFTGCVVPSFELSIDRQDILKLKVDVDAQAVATGTALATHSPVSGASLFTFAGASLYAGTFTAATSTALASATAALANITGFSLSLNRNGDMGRYFANGTGKKDIPVPGAPAGTGKIDIEYTDVVFRDAFLADTAFPIVANFVTPTSLSAGVETLQVAIGAVKLDGELPKAGGDVSKMSCSYTILDNLTDAPLTICLRTSDTAL